ncbi:Transposase DDE domain-containing protein [Singulisphaera sp. GP187]|uniref:IS4 family transposase n=1 Tax=Singulisphaera sp. GP187 TaxID=1882752 RepID=UPI000925C7B5|nr:IS4 family transposase [Singulisphaera sp. GP187]SIO02667.1 Transposase DDE domain-containing protein [Singulisphaera sp. GP187]
MAAKKPPLVDTPPSQRPERVGAPGWLSRDLPIWPDQVVGAKHIHSIERLIAQLRDQDPHGNRDLFLDDVFVAMLLAFFNPTLRTLRTIEDFSQTRQAQKFLSIQKLCKSTLSDFNKLADHTRLQPILDQLRRNVLKPSPNPNQAADPLSSLHRQVLAVDGTFLHAAASVAWSVRRRGGKTGARLDFHVDAQTWLPELIVVPEAGQSEATTAAYSITPGAIHLYDRGIFSFKLIKAHVEPAADFVMRFRKPGERTPNLETTETRELTQEARDADVISDRLVRFPGSTHRKPLGIVLREVVIVPKDDPENPVYLLTTLLEPDASIIGVLYRHRWQVELFFRWLKSYARFDHLISHSREGVLLSFYVAVIGVTLMCIHTGNRPSKYMFSLLGMVANGTATMDEIMPILRERERQCQLQRDRVARKRAEKPK